MNKLNNNEALQMNTVIPTMKKSLLALAVAGTMAMSGGAYAVDLAENDEWGDGIDAAAGTITDPSADMAVNVISYTLTINGTGDEVDVGAITGTTGTVAVTSATGAAVDSTIASITLSGAGDVTLTNVDNGNGATLAVTGALSIGGALTLLNSEATETAEHVTMTVTGNYAVTGITTVGAAVSNKSNAILNLNGTTISSGSYALNNTGTGLASMVFTGTGAQTVTGAINGAAASEGTVTVLSGANLVTFSDVIGTTNDLLAINVGSASVAANALFSADISAVTITIHTQVAADAVADFDGDVTADTAILITAGNASGELASASFAADVTGAITLDEGTSSTATATFDGAVAQSITGDIQGQGAGEGIVVISNTTAAVTFNDDIGDATNTLDSIQIASGATMKQLGNYDDALVFEVLGNIDADGAVGTGGTLTLQAGSELLATGTVSTITADIDGDVTLTTLNVLGGAARTATGTTDIGGAISDINIAGTTTAAVNITGGAGGAGLTNDSTIAGAGGAITAATFTGLITGDVTVLSGKGGAGGAGAATIGGAGGAGGAVTLTDATAGITGALDVSSADGGDGGAGHASTDGGAGGDGGEVTISAVDGVSTTVTVLTGTGGAAGSSAAAVNKGGAGGAGGAVTITDIDGAIGGAISLTAGNGGAGGLAGSTDAGSDGGDGGLLTVDDISGTGAATIGGNVTILAGTGAAAAAGDDAADVTGGDGGAGGAVVVTDVTSAITGNLSVTAGSGLDGASGAANVGDGGVGGAGGDATVTLSALLTGNASIISGTAGSGGAAGTGTGDGGAGGVGGNALVTFEAGITGTLSLDTGTAGSAGADGTGTAGAAGTASTATVKFRPTANATIGGATTVAADGEGIIIIDPDAAYSTTFTGAIGTSATRLGTLTVGGTARYGSGVFTGEVYADTITIGGTGATAVATTGDFNNNVAFTTLNITAGTDDSDDDDEHATATVSGNLTGTTIALIDAADDGTSTLNLDSLTAAQTISAAITASEDGLGNVTVSNTGGTVTFSETIGSHSTNLSVGTVSLAASSTTVFNKAVDSAAITATTTASSTFNAAVTNSGAITTGVGSTTVFDSTVSSATLSNSGAMTLKGAVTLSGTMTTVSGSTITLGSAFKAGSAAAITAASTSVGTLDQTVNAVTVNVNNQFTTGTVVLFKNTAAALDSDDLASFNVTDTAIVDYTAALSSTAKAIEITANKRTTAGIATYLGMSTAQSAALGQISAAVASGDATASTALDTVLVTGGSTAVNAAEQLNSDAGAAMGAAMAVTGGVNNVIAGRQANTKIAFNTLGKQSGVSTGDAANDAVVWAQVFTSDATQDKVNNIDGYDADSQGLVVGWEAEKAGSTFGLSLSFADTDVDGKSAAAAHIDTSSVQGTIYGSNGSADWMMGYASADNDTTRTINFGGLTTRTATGNYASNILMAKAGYSFDSIEMAGGVATLTPKADLSWTHINNDGYTETGASNLNLIVDSTSNDVVTARAGMEFAQRIENNGSVTIPRVSIMGGYDLNNDRAETTSTFTGGGSSFTTQGIDPSNASLELGVGVDHVSDDSTVSFNFNTNLKDGYNSDTASLTFKSKF